MSDGDEPKLGATGKFPLGMMDDVDEGEIQFRVGHSVETRTVMVDFGKPVAWLGMPAETARQLAELLIKHADAIGPPS